MATYVTKRCPHCHAAYAINQFKNQPNYGSPFRTCAKCGKGFIDKDFKEIAIDGYSDSVTRKIQPISIIGILMSIPFFFLGNDGGAASFGIPNWIAGMVILAIGIFLTVHDIRDQDDRIDYINREKASSEARLSDPEYARALKELGYHVPEKYLNNIIQNNNSLESIGENNNQVIANFYHDGEKESSIVEPKGKYKDVKIGDTLLLGMFNGIPLKWTVLDMEDNMYLLICKECICKAPFYVEGTIPINSTTHRLDCSDEMRAWRESSVRKYLNNDFFNSTFSDDEKETIINPSDRAEKDKLFLINRADVQKYYESDNDARVACLVNTNTAVMYWIKGITKGYCNAIGYRGNIVTSVPATDENIAIRPMMWIKG